MLEAALAELRRLRLDFVRRFRACRSSPRPKPSGATRYERSRSPAASSRRTISCDRCSPVSLGSRSLVWARKRRPSRELKHSLQTARERGSEYDIAATIDVLDGSRAMRMPRLARGSRRDPRNGSGSSGCPSPALLAGALVRAAGAAALTGCVYPWIDRIARRTVAVRANPGTSTVTSKPDVSSVYGSIDSTHGPMPSKSAVTARKQVDETGRCRREACPMRPRRRCCSRTRTSLRSRSQPSSILVASSGRTARS